MVALLDRAHFPVAQDIADREPVFHGRHAYLADKLVAAMHHHDGIGDKALLLADIKNDEIPIRVDRDNRS